MYNTKNLLPSDKETNQVMRIFKIINLKNNKNQSALYTKAQMLYPDNLYNKMIFI